MTATATTSFPLFAAAAVTGKDRLVVSLHDVAPPTWEASEKMLRELSRHGVRVSSLLVVPNYHRTGRSIEHAKFVDWLRELEGAGHEIVIHGYFHERAAKGNETLRERLVTQSYTSGEGEFYDLDYAESLRRITQAREEFAAARLQPRGFIAPAWLLSAEAERAAADAEMEYTTRLTSVLDLRSGEVFHARSLVYSVRNRWRRSASLAWNAAQARIQSSNSLLRLGIHPPDLAHANIWQQILKLADTLSEARTPTTYRDWLAERRSEAGVGPLKTA
ncbi:MAG: polysaccharide deacetylase family protein [Chthoniobacterales bacterium]